MADHHSATVGALSDPRGLNAVSHGLTSRRVLEAEIASFQAAIDDLKAHYLPQGAVEGAFVERLAVLTVRLSRAGRVEREMHSLCYSDGGFNQLAFERLVASAGRYELSIGRALAKTLHELERVQARREGEVQCEPRIIDFNW